MNEQEIREGLLKMHLLPIVGDIEYALTEKTKNAIAVLMASGGPDVVVLIDSAGGGVNAGLDIYDYLRLYPGKKTGFVIGQACSMAAVILQACEHRIASPHSIIHIHNLREKIPLDVLLNQKKLQPIIAASKRKQHAINKVLSLRTNRSVERIAARCAWDKSMTSEEAKDFGLIDMIAESPMPEFYHR